MAATITPLAVQSNPDTTGRQVIADGTIALTGNYGGGATNGDTLDLTQLGDALKTSQPVLKVDVWEDPAAGTAPTGYEFIYCPGTTLKNGVLAVMGTGASAGGPAQQYTQGSAYSAGLLAAALRVRVYAQSF